MSTPDTKLQQQPGFVRVACEFCKTVYNIPDSKLSRDVSQGTCKVCQNKIIIRKPAAAATRQPATTPTVVSDGPLPPKPSSSAATPQTVSPFADGSIPEQEVSDTWREAIVDNRETINLLKQKVEGVRLPDDRSTAAGSRGGPMPPVGATVAANVPLPSSPVSMDPPVVRAPDAPTASGDKLEIDTGKRPDLSVQSTARPAPAPAYRAPAKTDGRGASALVSLAGGFSAAAACAAIVLGGAFQSGLWSLGAIGACAFAASAGIVNGLLRRRGIVGTLVVLVLAAGAAVVTVAGAFLTGGDDARAFVDAYGFLAPLGPFIR